MVALIGDVIIVDVRAGYPPVGGPCLADQAADCNDRVGQVEECVDDILAAFVAALQPVEGVSGVRPFDMPALPGLDRCGRRPPPAGPGLADG